MQKGYIPKPLRGVIRAAYSVIESRACRYLDAVLYPEDISPYEGIVKECGHTQYSYAGRAQA